MEIRLVNINDASKLWEAINQNRLHLMTYFPKTLSQIKDLQSAVDFIDLKNKQAEDKEGYFFIIEEYDDMAGVVIVKDIDWSVPKAEIAYFVFRAFEGKGIMSSAIERLVDFCFQELGLMKLFARINPTNFGSKKVVMKNGFIKEGLFSNDYRNGYGILLDTEYYGLSNSRVG